MIHRPLITHPPVFGVMHVFSGLCKGLLRLPPVLTGLYDEAPGTARAAQRLAAIQPSAVARTRHRQRQNPEWAPDDQYPPSPRAPRRAWFLTWRSSAPAGAQGCATAQPAPERRSTGSA